MYHVICTPHHGKESWVSSEHETLAEAGDYAAAATCMNSICHYRVSPVDCPSGEDSDEMPQPLYCVMVTASYGGRTPHTPIKANRAFWGPVPFAEATRRFQESNECACYEPRRAAFGPRIYSVVQA